MHTFKVEIESQDVVDKVLWFLNSLKNKGVKISNSDDTFAIDVEHCLNTLKKSESSHNFKELSSSELFEEIGI